MNASLKKQLCSPLNYLEMGWSEFFKNIQIILLFSIFPSLLSFLLSSVFGLSILFEAPESLPFFLAPISFVFWVIIHVLPVIALINIVEFSLNNEQLAVFDALERAMPTTFSTAVVWAASWAVTSIGMVFLFIPGIWIGTFLCFTLHTSAARRCGFNSFRCSYRLVKGRWWDAFTRLVLIFLGLFLISLLFNLPLELIAPSDYGSMFSSPFEDIMARTLSEVVSELVFYYGLVSSTIMFLNFDYTHRAMSESNTISL